MTSCVSNNAGNSRTIRGGKRTRKNRNSRTTTSFNPNIKIKKFKNITSRHLSKKGIVYSIEKPEVISRDNTIDGDIIKKYVDGKLVGQKFITKNKLMELSADYNKRILGGKNIQQVPQQLPQQNNPGQPQTVYVQDQTTFGQSFKTGVGFALAFEFIDNIFN